MVSGDFVVKNEVMNDGGSIHIYFANKYNEFVAFGISAFQAMKTLKAKEIELTQDYSTEFQMPMVIISKRQLDELKYGGVTLKGTIEGQYYHLQSFIMMNEEAYDAWAQFLRT